MLKQTAIAAALLAGLAGAAIAQPNIAPELLHPERRAGNELAFCIGDESPLLEFERALATTLAETLLVEPVLYEYHGVYPARPYDYSLAIGYDEIFLLLTNECDVFMGLTLAPDPIDDSLTYTRPVYETGFALVTRAADGYADLGAIPATGRIGARIGGAGDIRYNAYARNAGAGNAPLLLQYPDNLLMFERLLDGTADGLIVWEPVVPALVERFGGTEPLAVGPTDPLTIAPLQFGLALMRNNSFLRASLDEAIAFLLADGTITALLAEYGVDATAAR